VKFIMDIRSMPVEIFGLRGSLQRLSFNLAVIAARETFNGMTIITSSMKQEISETFGMNPAAIGVWTSGVSKALFNPEVRKSNGQELRKKLGLNGKFVVFYHGSLSATRGILESVEAMGLAKDKNPHLVLFLLGGGPLFTRIEELIKKEGLEAYVIVHRPVPYVEVPNYIAMSDVCIIPLPHHPYWNSQSPLKLMEYLAMEKPIILTNIPAHKSIVGNSDCAIFIPSAKPEIIADAIQLAYKNKNKLSEWGETGRKIVMERFTWEKISENLENYLLSIG
jgi:glycosyltransferase involved in cell wall biosynthesis